MNVSGNITNTAGTVTASLLAGYTPANGNAVVFLTQNTAAPSIANFATAPSLPVGFSTTYNAVAGEAARLVYAAGGTINFTNANGNLDWSTAANWNGNVLPGASDTALISAGLAVTHASGTHSVAGLTVNSGNFLDVSGGSLEVSGITTLGGTLTVSGSGSATLNGTLSAGSTGAVAVSGGTLALNGAATISQFTMTGGAFSQIASTLPTFSATAFNISGGTYIRALNSSLTNIGTPINPYQLTDIYGVQGMGSTGMRNKSYTLANDIVATGTSGWNGGNGFVSIGTSGVAANRFTGRLDGGGFSISNLRARGSDYVGLFGYVDGSAGGGAGTISNLKLVGVDVSASGQAVGALVGEIDDGFISNSSATGTVVGDSYVGGLVGYNNRSSISNSTASVTVSPYFTSGVVFGGLTGLNSGAISNSYATGAVSVGSTGAVAGGLVGDNILNTISGTIDKSYSTGAVTGGTVLGGLLGRLTAGTVTNSYWDTQTSGQALSAGGSGAVGKTTAEVKQFATFSGWDVSKTGGSSSVWRIYEDNTTPLLRSLLTPLTLTGAPDAAVTYNASPQTGGTYTLAANIFGAAATGTNAGFYNGYFSNQQGYDLVGGNLTISAAALNIVSLAGTRDYDGTNVVNANIFGSAGVINGVSGQTLTLTGAGTVLDPNVGINKTVSLVNLTLNNGTNGGLASNYTLNGGTHTATINQAPLTLSAARSYTGTTDLTGAVTVIGLVNNEVLNYTGATASSSQVATQGKHISAITLQDGPANPPNGKNQGLQSNYLLPTTLSGANAPVTITTAPLAIKANDFTKPYGQTATFAGTEFTPTGLQDNETVASVTLTSAGASPTATVNGGPYAIIPSNATGGNFNASNYAVTYENGLLTVTPAMLTVIAASLTGSVVKPYDGTNLATLSPGNFLLSGFVNADSASVTKTSGVFASKNVGANITVSASLAASDFAPNGATDLKNYLLPTTASGAIGTITPKSVTVSSITADNKVYDGTTKATLTGGVVQGVIAGDSATLSGATGVFANKNVGNGKTVTVNGLTLAGADGANYTLDAANISTTANITPKALTVGTLTAANKVYDGTVTATLSGGTLTGAIAGDNITLSTPTGVFDNKNAGTAKPITVTGLALTGADQGNYTFTPASANVSANITPKALTVSSLTAANKVYDGTTAATLSGGTLSGAIAGDNIALSTPTGVFDNKNVGNSKPISVTGLALSGADQGNYSFTPASVSVSASITPKALTVSSVTAANKVYDGTTAATLSGGTVTGAIAGDNVSLSAPSGSFNDKNAGTDKTVNVTGLALTGADLGNYTASTGSVSTTADITPITLTVSSVTAANKVYDGTTTATLSGGTLTGAIAGDSIALSAPVGSFDNKNVGTAKPIALTGLSLSGADTGNYTLSSVPNSTQANITAKPLTITGITAANKVYDGKLDATLSGGTLVGVVAGDSVALSAPTGTFADKNAGTAKAINVTGLALSGTDVGNYTVTAGSTSTTADITVRPSSTWSGAAGNNSWNDAGNWDALPDGANVLAVNIGNTGAGSGTVAFDAGSATLQNLSSGQTLAVGGGTLQISGALTTSGFSQTGGAVTGAGSFTASGTFNQSGGSIDMASITATQGSGNININNLKAASVNLTGGSISQSAAGGIETTTLTTQSTGGTVLTGTGNRIGTWNAFNTGSGVLRLSNTGLINVTAINDGGDFNIDSFGGVVTKGQIKTSGAISITANSPLTVGVNGLLAGGDIALTATNLTSQGNITLDGPIESATGGVNINAAGSFAQNSSIKAPKGVSASVSGTLSIGPLATTGFQPVSYVVASAPVTPPPPPGTLSTASDMVVAMIAAAPAVETPAEKQVQAAANVPVPEKEKEKDTSKETVVAEGGVCRP